VKSRHSRNRVEYELAHTDSCRRSNVETINVDRAIGNHHEPLPAIEFRWCTSETSEFSKSNGFVLNVNPNLYNCL